MAACGPMHPAIWRFAQIPCRHQDRHRL